MDDYDIIDKIGEGAQGTVFRVFHRPSRQEHAMKVIRCKDQAQVNFALREIKVLLQLRNPHIVSYVDFFVTLQGAAPRDLHTSASSALSVSLVMELCHHENLEDRVKAAKRHFMDTGTHLIPEEAAASWILQAAEALKYIHERGFLHRDMKPTNVFFSRHGNVKLGDFGLATTAGLGKESTVGTPYYFAPELLLKQTYSSKVDIWGLGIVFLELLTLRERPLNSQLLENPMEVESVVSDIVAMGFSTLLATLIRDMLCRNPDGRPSPAAIIQRLTRKTASSAPVTPVCLPPALIPGVCHLCEVDGVELSCADCRASFCKTCDMVKHKHPSRNGHRRSGVVASPLTEGGTAPVATGGGSQVIKCHTNSPTRKTVTVPSDECKTLADAVALAQTDGNVERIVLLPGQHSSSPIVLGSTTPDGLEIVGSAPTPILEIRTAGPALLLDTKRSGRIANIIVVQVRDGSALPSTAVDTTARPCALEIRSGDWVVKSCRFSSQSGCGAVVAGGSAIPAFYQCHFSEVKQAGALFTDGAQGLVKGCTFSGCEYAGVLLKKGARPRIVECVVCEGKETGIYCHECSPFIEGNKIHANGGCGIVVKGAAAAPLVVANHVQDNCQAGIFVCDSATPVLQDNDISGNRKAGVIVKTQANPKVQRNTVSGSVEAGIFVFEGGNGHFEENNITGNSNAGVLVTSRGSPVFVSNRIRKNAYEGVWICKGGAGSFSENDLRGNLKGARDIEAGCAVQWVNNREE